MNPRLIAFFVIAASLTSCESLRERFQEKVEGPDRYLQGVGSSAGVQTDIPPEARLGQGFWDKPAGVKGAPHIVLELDKQKVFYYFGTTLVGTSPMSSGKEGHNTPKGEYKIIQKDANYKSGTYGVLRSRATGATVSSDFNTHSGQSIPAGAYFDPAPMPYFMRITGGYGMHVGFVTGYPVSHGCVRLPEDMAKIFFNNTPLGTRVTIK